MRSALDQVRLGNRLPRHLDAILEANARLAVVLLPGFIIGIARPDLPLARARLWQFQI